MALAVMWTCDSGGDSKPPAAVTLDRAPQIALSERDLDVYATGTKAQIGLLRGAINAGRPISPALPDSAAARAAHVSVEEFQTIRAAVEAALKTQETLANRAAGLDSLRVELLVLRVRAETMP